MAKDGNTILAFFVQTVLIAVSGSKGSFPSNRCPCAELEELPELDPADAPQSLNRTYGIGCGAHDLQNPLCRQAKKPCTTLIPVPPWCHEDRSWCDLRWCYIKDPGNCSLAYARSGAFALRSFKKDVFYSYATCGDRDASSGDSIAYALSGKVLQVTYRSSSTGWKSANNPGGNVIDANWHGPMVDLLAAAALNAGFTINTTDAPAEVLDRSGEPTNTKRQCTYATGLGYLGACVGLSPQNDWYMSHSEFVTILSEPVYMVTSVAEVSLWTQFWSFSKPFETKLWIAMLGCIAFVSVALMAQERRADDGQFQDMSFTERVCNTLYFGFASFVSVGVVHEPVTSGGKIISLGLGLFVLVFVSAYTARLAASLVTATSGPMFDNLQKVVDNGYVVCATSSVISTLTAVHPNAVTYKARKRALVMDGIDGGQCDVALLYYEDFQAAQADGKHCSKVTVGKPFCHISKGLAVGPSNARALGWHIQHQLNQGVLDAIMAKHQPVNKCSGYQETRYDGFILQDMTGIFIITLFLTIVGIIVNILRRRTLNAALLNNINSGNNQNSKAMPDASTRDRTDEAASSPEAAAVGAPALSGIWRGSL